MSMVVGAYHLVTNNQEKVSVEKANFMSSATSNRSICDTHWVKMGISSEVGKFY